MNHVLSLVQAARTSTAQESKLTSVSMMIALVALHEDMVDQLRLELLGTVGNTALLTDLIDQHENAAHLLREKLGHHAAEPAKDNANPIMPSKFKTQPAKLAAAIKPLRPHDVTHRAPGSGNLASHRHILATQTASGRSEPARHHASPRAQS